MVKQQKTRKQKASGQRDTRANRSREKAPSFIRTVPSTPELHRVMRRLALVGYTTDRELGRQALTLPRRKYSIFRNFSIKRGEGVSKNVIKFLDIQPFSRSYNFPEIRRRQKR